MFRSMRRKKQCLSLQESIDILNRRTSGVLAVSGDGGYPYAVPMSYVYRDSRIFFHSAKQGHKLDAVLGNDKVSFCVVDQDEVQTQKFTTYFRSVIVFGRAHILQDDAAKRKAIGWLAEKYSPDEGPGRLAEIEREFSNLCMIELTIEHISGKEAIELVKRK